MVVVAPLHADTRPGTDEHADESNGGEADLSSHVVEPQRCVVMSYCMFMKVDVACSRNANYACENSNREIRNEKFEKIENKTKCNPK